MTTLEKESAGVLNGRQWKSWGRWSSCSKTCGEGTQTRRRECINQNCSSVSLENRNCSIQTCHAKSTQSSLWGIWSPWSDCSVTCGLGIRSKKKKCGFLRYTTFSRCRKNNVLNERCMKKSCPVDGNWSRWSEWSSCSVTCGQGKQIRKRTCTNPAPSNGGRYCTGPVLQTLSCIKDLCPVNGGWGAWTGWTACSITCGNGKLTRHRRCDSPTPSKSGKYCIGLPYGNRQCVKKSCPVDGTWSNWSRWSKCSVTCGRGTLISSRTCTNPSPAYGGKNCTGGASKTNSCYTQNDCADFSKSTSNTKNESLWYESSTISITTLVQMEKNETVQNDTGFGGVLYIVFLVLVPSILVIIVISTLTAVILTKRFGLILSRRHAPGEGLHDSTGDMDNSVYSLASSAETYSIGSFKSVCSEDF